MAWVTNQFGQVVRRQDPAVFDLELEVAKMWQHFPALKNKVLFVDVGAGGKLVYPETGAERQQAEKLIELHKVGETIAAVQRKYGYGAFCGTAPGGLRFVALEREKYPYGLIASQAPLAQELAFTYDHEVGHAAAEKGSYLHNTHNKAESIADAYAVIRHFQRYGADSPAVDAIVANRCFAMIFREPNYGRDHFTSPVTERILANRYKINWDKLSPEETIAMAEKFVAGHALDEHVLDSLHESFNDLHNRASAVKNGNRAPVQMLAQKLLETQSSAVFKYGMMGLKVCLDKPDDNFRTPFWNNLREKLAEKRKEFTGNQPRSAPGPMRL